jgi:hypothetical protein
MRSIVSLMLLVPAFALAVTMQPVTALPEGGNLPPAGPQSGPGPSHEARFTIGTVDTVGGTTYDWGANGPALRMLVQTPGRGIHALWMYSTATTGTDFPDRNMRYNYYDFSTHAWNWTDADFMQSGVNVYSTRTGYGTISTDTNGAAVVSAHHSTGAGQWDVAPIIARDAEVGAGIFDYAPGEPAIDQHVWPYIGVGTNGVYQLAMIDASSQDNLLWTRTTDAGANWEAAMAIPNPQPEPYFPTHNIATSRVSGSNKVCITWTSGPPSGSGYQQDPGFYRESQDAGVTWDDPVDLGYPPAFSEDPDSLVSYHITSLFPMYDKHDRLHIVGNVAPYVRDTNWILPGEIWHWCAANPNTWDRIHIASPESLNAAVGYNTMIVARPSLGEDGSGNLFVAWEEFDGVNVEQTTSRVRADIWTSYSTDNGVTWADGMKITDGGEVSYRFPSILNPIGDTVMVEYLIDQVAGFFLYSEGPATSNPIVIQKWANPIPPAVEGPKVAPPARMDVAAGPNPFRRSTQLSYSVPYRGNVSLDIFDAVGRNVATLAKGQSEAGRFDAVWDGRSQSGALVPGGVYLYRYALDDKLMTGKLTLTR